MQGVIIKALSGFYYVYSDGVTYECKARGSFRKNGVSPLVGDRVEFEKTDENKGIVDKIYPRKNSISRPPVANIDKLFIISSFENPTPNTFLIDKMTVIAEYNGIEPIIVFNKCDMGDFSAWQKIYLNAGFKVYVVSADTGEGIAELQKELAVCVSAFTGNSGVGKSSILNCLLGGDFVATGEVSEKIGRGRHTTRHTELYTVSNDGFVVDTPGFSSIEVGMDDYELKEKLPFLFSDFSDYLDDCRFSSCSHTKESGCSVLNALSEGKIEPSRHASYIQLFEDMKDLKPWNVKKKK